LNSTKAKNTGTFVQKDRGAFLQHKQKIIAAGDTIIIHFSLFNIHYSLSGTADKVISKK
jgi:hypothetical protein